MITSNLLRGESWVDEVDRKLVIDTFIGTPAGELQRGIAGMNIIRLW